MTYTSPVQVFAQERPVARPSVQMPGTAVRAPAFGNAGHGQRLIADGLASIGTLVRIHPGETLYVEGEPADKCYEVISGLIKEYNTLKDGSRHIADFRYCGDLMGLPGSGVYQHTVEAVEESRLVSYPAGRFRQIVAEMPTLSNWFAERLLSDLERARSDGLALSRLSAMERVARFLLTLSRATEPKERLDGAFAIPMSRQDMADHLGLTIETVCRCLTTLKRKGLISMATAHGFTIPDAAALAALANREDAPASART